jgi:cysteine synthase A/phenylacetate-CoA ligase
MARAAAGIELDSADRDLITTAARQAATRFAWYRNGYWARGALPAMLSEVDLVAYYADVAGKKRGRTYLTSGTTTGAPKCVWWPASDHRRYVRLRGDLLARFAGGSCRTACGDLGTGHAAASSPEVFAAAGLTGGTIDVDLPVERHVELLRKTKPDFLFTMPMILERIIDAGGPGYTPRRIAVLGDLAGVEWRAAIAHRIGMDPRHVLDLFGSIEAGAIAYWDEAVGAYLFHERIVPELVPVDGYSPDTGPLAITSLERTGFPVVRYASGDVVGGLARFERDGQTRWGYRVHLGRRGSELKHGEMLSVHAVGIALAQAAPGVAWQIRRSGLEVIIGIDERAWSPALARTISAAVAAAHPAVEVMVRNGLVGQIAVVPESFSVTGPKRSVGAG